MLSLDRILTTENGAAADLAANIRDGKDVSAFGLPFYARMAVAALQKRFVYVVSDISLAREAYDFFAAVCPRTVLLPPRFDVLLYKRLSSDSSDGDRFAALFDAACGDANVVVTTAAALLQLYPTAARLAEHAVTLTVGGEYELDGLGKRLTAAGYRRVSEVTACGTYAIRGDIVDVWGAGNRPVRAEFFGDTLETLHFIGEDNRRQEETGGYRIRPFATTFATDDERQAVFGGVRQRPKLEPDYAARYEQLCGEAVEALENGGNLDFAAPLCAHVSLLDLLGDRPVVFDDAKLIYDTMAAVYQEHCARFATLLERGETFPFSLKQMLPPETAVATAAQKLAFHAVTGQNRLFTPTAVVSFVGTAMPSYARDFRLLLTDIRAWRERYRVFLCCGSAETRKSVEEFLRANYESFSETYGGDVVVADDFLPHGAILHEYNAVIIGTYDLTVKRAKKALRRSKRNAFVQPQPGDYVVHETHGIGLCEGIKRMEMGGGERDYVVVRYRDGQLYLPAENLDSLSKYVSGEAEPKLNKLGGAEFSKVKERVLHSVRGMAIDLAKLYAEREMARGKKYTDDDTLDVAFADAFPHDETPDQLDAVAAGLKDLTDGKIMDRLLCGDVGYGKTEVALRLAFKVIMGGGQVAFVSPTTILSRQHFRTAAARLEPFGVKAVALNRFNTPAETKAALAAIADGTADIVCGTHRVLSADVHFKSLEMLILDEEQRFGVADKEKLKTVRKNVNVLSLSATPIPRTLHMAMTGIRDISVLDTPPVGRLPVQTFVAELTDTLIVDAVERELSRGGQVFIVYNRVESIRSFAASVGRLLPGHTVAVAHGQMDEATLARTIDGFTAGESDVLVASTIIENGIDLPNANTMIVVDADRLGLSQLYQLRGRVGRSDRLAYVYFTFTAGKPLTDSAYKRLEAITQYTELGSGFKIAMADLEIRGAGNILGREQHGHMEKVGYDMYCKLLSRAVKELAGSAGRDREEVRVDTDYRAFLPEDYIADASQRFSAYARIAETDSTAARAEVLAELKDIYGAVPAPAENLVTVALIKNLAADLGAEAVTVKRRLGAITFSKAQDVRPQVAEQLEKTPDARIDMTGKPRIVFGEVPAMLKFLLLAAKKPV